MNVKSILINNTNSESMSNSQLEMYNSMTML